MPSKQMTLSNLIFTSSKAFRGEAWKNLFFRIGIYLNPQQPLKFPNTVQIEATSKCNLRCPSCSNSREKVPGKHLTDEELKRILDKLPSRPSKVRLSGIGEPLMNPHFFSLVDILAERDIKCDFITNGTLLTPYIRGEILSRTNIEIIAISCDGASKTTFETLRLGADFDVWKKRVNSFLDEAKEKRSPTLNFISSIVISKTNIAEIREIIRLVAEIGFEKVWFFTAIPVDDIAALISPSPKEINEVPHEELSLLASSLGVKILTSPWSSLVLPKSILHCIQPWEYIFIRANGDVAPCCAIFGSEKELVMGNIYNQDFINIWRGEKFRIFRQTLVSGTNEFCRICPYY
jgi:radical SAM protein with 4Fe4S-binding SPASM domain